MMATARQAGAFRATGKLFRDAVQLVLRIFEPANQLASADEFDIVFDKVEAGFQIGQQIEQIVSEQLQWARQAAGELRQRRFELASIIGIDHSQHGFGLHQIDPTGQKCPQRKFASICQACAAAHKTWSSALKSAATRAYEFPPAVAV